jgi:hypothetical protein
VFRDVPVAESDEDKPGRTIEELILSIRDQRVILAGDLAAVYGVETRRLNEQVRRNAARFPADFVFQLSKQEFEQLVSRSVILADGRAALRSQNAILKRGQHVKFPPYAFTEHGAVMAAMVLNSPEALAMSVYVVRAFVSMRERLAANEAILRRLAEIDQALLQHDASLRDIYHKLLPLLQPSPDPPKRRIGFTAGD